MANTTTKSKTSAKSVGDVAATPSTQDATVESTKADPPAAPVVDNTTKDDTSSKPIVPKDIDLNQIVTVRNGFHGKLVYQSRKTGELFEWEEFGAEQDMELGELRNARSSGKKYFTENWFLFDEPWIVNYLGMEKYYKNSLSVEELDELFTKPADEIEAILKNVPDGQKRSIAYYAGQLIANKGIDSFKTITMLERVLGIELVER